MANIKLRFSIYTENDEENISLIAKKLPSFSLNAVYKKGEKEGKHFHKESSIDYIYIFNSITSIEEINNFFIQQWNEYYGFLKKLLEASYIAYLLYEFDMDDSDVFPEMIYKKEFLKFLADTGIELQLYYYPM